MAIPQRRSNFFQVAVPYELGKPRSSLQGFFEALYPIYVRGQAYLATRQGIEAATEFQKILDDLGIMIGDPVSALAKRKAELPDRLRLGPLPAGFVTDCDRTTNPTEQEEPASGSHLLGMKPLSRAASRSF